MLILNSEIISLPLLSRGKVRDIYALDDKHLLIITTDRLSAFDVILPDPIPQKGLILNNIAKFWFNKFANIIPNHLTNITAEEVVNSREIEQVQGRAIVVKRLHALPIEAVVRGFIIGSGWKDYQATGMICDQKLPLGLSLASRLPEAIFTPATKAEIGDHDENISFTLVKEHISKYLTQLILNNKLAVKLDPSIHADFISEEIRRVALEIYNQASKYAIERGIIIADTKLEFGIDDHGKLHLIDEILTPDSSRFWAEKNYQPGGSPDSYDKQFIRDYLESLDWDKTPPAPSLPPEVIRQTTAKYLEAYTVLTGQELA